MRNLKSHYVKIVDESILFFSRVSLSKFSLKILFGSFQYFVGIKGIYTGVRKDLVKESLKDVTMERVRVEKLEESLCKDCG